MSAAIPLPRETQELLVDVRDGVAAVTLNRPASLNALSWDMILGLRDRLDAWEHDGAVRSIMLRGAGERAFCAGGDIRMFHEDFRAHGVASHDFFTVEYALDFRIHTYPKPIVAVMDGIVMGGGMGLAQGAARRIVGDRTRMAMPETAIGLFPDVGGSYFLSRTPGAIGEYLGLAGPTITAADALYAGLADEYAGTQPLPASGLEAVREAIERHFNAPAVEAIVESLAHETQHREWADRTRAALLRNSPTALKVTLEQIRRGRTLPLADCFRMELNLVRNALDHGDFFEGIRAAVIDKDRNPRWKPSRLEEVSRADVERFFEPRWTPAHNHPLSHL